ncbi:hypothetical protein FH972_001260 [Carpinus fangiana]|uniref:PRA1 family protein n=1 Tax=Carpinus fangiana TaxID=176857 RepID=A0A5N6QBD6_9ROSI|nr:hypothetical protein FH972_001260 [Carpinus fangiana]
MASAPTIPISNPSQSSQAPIATPAFRLFISRISSSIRHGFSQRRPWYEVVDRSAMTRPESLTEAYSRIRKNLSYFRSDQPLVILGRTFSDRETLLGLSLLTIIVVFLTTVGSLLISALMVGFAIVCAHGAFRVPEDLFLDEQEPANAGTNYEGSFAWEIGANDRGFDMLTFLCLLFVFPKPVNSNITQSNHGLGHWTGVMNSLPP